MILMRNFKVTSKLIQNLTVFQLSYFPVLVISIHETPSEDDTVGVPECNMVAMAQVMLWDAVYDPVPREHILHPVAWAKLPKLPLPRCVYFTKLLNLCKLQFPHL